MEKWFVAAKRADFDKWAEDFNISPVLARILRNRELTDETQIERFLHGTIDELYSPWLLKDMDRAADIILSALSAKKKLRVIGDYDADGICSSYILTEGLKILGADVDTAIPHRIYDGYGLNDQLIEEAARDGVELIITCDNGIAAARQIGLASDKGIAVIVTDHHEVPFEEENGVRRELLPPAEAVVDPKQEGCTYPFDGICGAVVAYKLMSALAERTGSGALERAMDEFLQFAAIATVCDVMELKDENRIIVKEGIKRIQNTQNEGMKALIAVTDTDVSKLSAYHLGFVLGPCLNATGRLDSASLALELFQSRTRAEACLAAGELKRLNDTRKGLTAKGVEEAEKYITEHHMEKYPVMLIYLPEVHESIAGIIAGRIREKYNHPVFVLTKGENGVKGSGRSIEGYNMFEHMTRQKHYFTKFGGHKLAAGLSMREEDIEALQKALNNDCNLKEEDFIPRVHIDIAMPLYYADERLASELSLLEPYGVGNPRPLFAQKNLRLIRGMRMGANKNYARFMVLTPEGYEVQLVFFGDLDAFEEFLDNRYGNSASERLYNEKCSYEISVVYQLGLNTYRGKTEVQYIMRHYC
ncbi:MAG: single-stranded-DNA-specific exonuclease RecJ [Lachnospiraceae bacterium]|nr:single-stranded-DNA-specific exonuclease RecJ [Lachnospiraceae bacterium]